MRWRWLFLLPLFFVFSYLALSSSSPLMVVQVDQSLGSGYIGIFRGNSIGQTFISTSDGLAGVSLFVGPYTETNATSIIFHLRAQTGQELRTVFMNTSLIINNQYNNFGFSEIPDSAGKQFYFTVELANSTNPTNRVYFGYYQGEAYPDGSAFQNGVPMQGDLTFRAYSMTTPKSILYSLCARASRDPFFFGIYLFTLGSLSVMLIKVWTSQKKAHLEPNVRKLCNNPEELSCMLTIPLWFPALGSR